MNINPLVYSVIGLVAVILQVWMNMHIARHLLPQVRRAHELPLDKRISLLAFASQKTYEIKYQRLVVLAIIYFPVLYVIGKDRWLSLPTICFGLVICMQIFIVWVANNHLKIVNLQFESFTLQEAEAYLAHVERH